MSYVSKVGNSLIVRNTNPKSKLRENEINHQMKAVFINLKT